MTTVYKSPDTSGTQGENVGIALKFGATSPAFKTAFLHFTAPGTPAVTVFYDYHAPPPPFPAAVEYTRLVSIPASVAPGTYDIWAGFMDPFWGSREPVYAASGSGVTIDTHSRAWVGQVTVTASGAPVVVDVDLEALGAAAQSFADFLAPRDPLRSKWVPIGYDLVFGDEFNGDRLNQEKWWTRYPFDGPDGPGTLDWFPNEHGLQRFRETGNHVVSGGTLKLIANPPVAPATTWTSGLIRSKKKFGKYGYYEMRAKVPSGLGTWATWWLSKEVYGIGRPEIDMVERVHNGTFPSNLDTIHMGAIGSTGFPDGSGAWPGASQNQLLEADANYHYDQTYWKAPFNLNNDFHVFRMLWEDDIVTVWVDDVKIFKLRYRWVNIDGTPGGPATMIANLGIGGDWPGPPDLVQQVYEIDYIRVYQRSKDAEPSTLGKDYAVT